MVESKPAVRYSPSVACVCVCVVCRVSCVACVACVVCDGTHTACVMFHVRCVRPQCRKYMIRVDDGTRQLVKDCLVSFIARVACLPLINIEYRMELTNQGRGQLSVLSLFFPPFLFLRAILAMVVVVLALSLSCRIRCVLCGHLQWRRCIRFASSCVCVCVCVCVCACGCVAPTHFCWWCQQWQGSTRGCWRSCGWCPTSAATTSSWAASTPSSTASNQNRLVYDCRLDGAI